LMATVIRMFLSQDKLVLIKSLKTLYQWWQWCFFIELSAFEGVYNNSIAFSDIDGDGDQDVLITGYGSSYQRISKLYTNDGMVFPKLLAPLLKELILVPSPFQILMATVTGCSYYGRC
jgi:hypothetical protein